MTYNLTNRTLDLPALFRVALETSTQPVLVSELHHAWQRQELQLYYQPQVDLMTAKITGMEALLRWRSPERGLVLPKEFMAIAEDTGLICQMGTWAIREACRQAKEWQIGGFPQLSIAVNISARQFEQPNLMQEIVQILEELEFDPSFLVVEVTEALAVQNIDLMVASLYALHIMGVRIAIDDFGTGFSSLNALRRFPIHAIKIDRTFVEEIVINKRTATIVASTIDLCSKLNIKVVAEGVETVSQLCCLRRMQCHTAQGYLLSSPLPSNFATEFLHRHK